MAREQHVATAAEVDRVRPDPGRRLEIPAGGGLWLLVQRSGTKAWAFRYRVGGGQRKLALGRCVSRHARPGEVVETGPSAALTLSAARKAGGGGRPGG